MCPVAGCRGVPSSNQQAAIDSLWERACSGNRLVGNLSAGSGSKLDDVQLELASLEAVFDGLVELVYGAARQSATVATPGASTSVVPTVAWLPRLPFLQCCGGSIRHRICLNPLGMPFFPPIHY